MIIPLFSSPLYQTNVPVDQHEIDLVTNTQYNRSEGNNGYISTNQQLITPTLEDKLDPHISHYIHNELQIQQSFQIINSWCNKHTKGDYLPQHSHANSIFTGIYYIQVPPQSGNILSLHQSPFIPSFVPGTVIPTINESNIYNSKTLDIQLEEGTLLLFPSHIEHSAPQSQSDQVRYAISFNIFLHGEFGDSTNRLSISCHNTHMAD